MLTFQDFADYCDLSDDEIQSILNGASVPRIETCAIVPEKWDSRQECQKIDGLLPLYLDNSKKYFQ